MGKQELDQFRGIVGKGASSSESVTGSKILSAAEGRGLVWLEIFSEARFRGCYNDFAL